MCFASYLVLLVGVIVQKMLMLFSTWVRTARSVGRRNRHQADCGNALLTTYMGAAQDECGEGALILPAVEVAVPRSS